MARPRSIPDAEVFDAVLALLREGGAKRVTFAAVSGRSGLAPSSLAERHGSVAGMIAAARSGAWDRLEAETDAALSTVPLSAKGAVLLLKALPAPETIDIGHDPARARAWRERLELSLAVRLGGGEAGRLRAAILFSHWFSQGMWQISGYRAPRLKTLLRLIG